MADVSVRPARTGDVNEIARIQVETWQLAYATILPQPVLAALSIEAAAAAWTAAVTDAPSGRHHVLVALEQDRVVGFVALGPTDDLQPADPEQDTTVGVGPILVEARWGRRGHGSRLMSAAVEHARLDGMTRAIGWIPEGDTVSREFLIGCGWAPDGLARALDTGAGEMREIRLHAGLSAT